jgi:hypothetical protein
MIWCKIHFFLKKVPIFSFSETERMSSSENDSDDEVLKPGEVDGSEGEEGEEEGGDGLGLLENKESSKVSKSGKDVKVSVSSCTDMPNPTTDSIRLLMRIRNTGNSECAPSAWRPKIFVGAFWSLYKICTVWMSIILQFTNIYSNTLVHSSPHLPVYCMGRCVRLHCFFQMDILDMMQHFMH